MPSEIEFEIASAARRESAAMDEELRPPSGWPRLLDRLFEMRRRTALLYVAILSIVIAAVDSAVEANVSVGLLYLFPLVVGSLALSRWQMVMLGLACALLREHFSPFGWEPLAASRVSMTFLAFSGIGLLLNEIARNRRLTLRHYRELSEQVARRKETEDQIETLVRSTPAAIIILDSLGEVKLCNRAAEELLAMQQGALLGRRIGDFLPTLASVATDSESSTPYRTATVCRGRRADGEYFQACVWFATYDTREGKHLATIITDSSEDLRDFQESSFQSLLKSTRVLVGSVSHEIRNVCAAISVVHANLGRLPGVSASEDYAALGTLAQGLERLATVEMPSGSEPEPGIVNVSTLLEEFRIVVDPAIEAESVDLEIRPGDDLPPAMGDHHGLLQVLLNLARNSIRAMQGSQERKLTVTACGDGEVVLIRFGDTGPGVTNPDRLFQAFQQGADAVGLGLFISRALVRSSGGDLYYEPGGAGCTMCIRLRAWTSGLESIGPADISEMHA
jgi:two-component system, LuxR family, sensor kinase FixL